ncbi:NAD-dependent epimerase/dehydratase family protein [Methylocaldum sp.]|uniref:NAD-dependent epimerase/dehydratase family protein n=1 Tax=Methylocaldum sp. TaxID=1969727 RepID=UPI002D5E3FDE|nr:NAD-dependent epimerase/dehydratase family protein [Methylocaldum sp.]HYE33983.1 NAD-dependent epimerase/dehydratase family protein [Methylocaldum sp.]
MNEILTSQNKVLVTGPTSFLGYHVTKRLNERGIRPRALIPQDADPSALRDLNVDIVRGTVEDAASLRAACDGVDTIFHLAFLVSIGGGQETRMQQVNVVGTRNLLDVALDSGVARVVVTSSALAVGVSRESQPLNETADWTLHRLDLPYAASRRQAEEEALARSSQKMSVVAVNPSFTMGPEDYVGAPANKLLKAVSAGKLPFTVPVGFGCLDVRDFAEGMLLAAERGRPGQRYLLNGHNVMVDELLGQAAAIAGVRPPRWRLPIWAAYVLVTMLQAGYALARKPFPLSRSVLQILGRYAWYDTARAREELGWNPRPLQQTLEDTLRWLGQSEAG